jgi:hypothetical protein
LKNLKGERTVFRYWLRNWKKKLNSPKIIDKLKAVINQKNIGGGVGEFLCASILGTRCFN